MGRRNRQNGMSFGRQMTVAMVSAVSIPKNTPYHAIIVVDRALETASGLITLTRPLGSAVAGIRKQSRQR